MKKEELARGLASAYGKERAEEMIDQVIRDAGLLVKPEYSKQELLRICEHMVSCPDRFLNIVGRFLNARVLLMED